MFTIEVFPRPFSSVGIQHTNTSSYCPYTLSKPELEDDGHSAYRATVRLDTKFEGTAFSACTIVYRSTFSARFFNVALKWCFSWEEHSLFLPASFLSVLSVPKETASGRCEQ